MNFQNVGGGMGLQENIHPWAKINVTLSNHKVLRFQQDRKSGVVWTSSCHSRKDDIFGFLDSIVEMRSRVIFFFAPSFTELSLQFKCCTLNVNILDLNIFFICRLSPKNQFFFQESSSDKFWMVYRKTFQDFKTVLC